MISKIKENKFLIVVMLLALGGVMLPLLQQNIIEGSDDTFHLIRIETLATALQRGEFPVKVHSDLVYGFGYGVGLFYSNFFLYIPAFLICAGLSLEVSYKIFEIIMFIVTFINMFLATYRIGKNKYTALMAGILYIYSSTVLFNHYSVFSVGRWQAIAFFPLAIGGLYRVIKENKDAVLLGIGFIGLIYSHVLSTVVALMASVFIAIVYIKDWIRSWRKWKTLIVTVISVVFVTAAYWIPFIEQVLSQKFRYSIPWTYVDENVMRLYDLLTEQGIGFVLVIISILMAIWIVENIKHKEINRLYFSALIFLLLPSFSAFWTIFNKVFQYLQFPERLLIAGVVLLLMAFTLWMNCFHFSISVQKMMTVALLIVSLYCANEYFDTRVGKLVDYGNRVLHEEIAGLGAGEEYLPVQTNRSVLVDPLIAYDDQGNQIEGYREDGKYIFETESESKYYDVPLVYYKGYIAEDIEGNMNLEISQVEETGLVRVEVDDSVYKGRTYIAVWYKGTIAQSISYWITAISILLYVVLLIRAVWNKKMRGKVRNEKEQIESVL